MTPAGEPSPFGVFTPQGGTFTVTGFHCETGTPPPAAAAARTALGYLLTPAIHGPSAPHAPSSRACPTASLRLTLDAAVPAEGYTLHITHDGVRIAGGDSAGLFYGCLALRDLLPPDAWRAAPPDAGSWDRRHQPATRSQTTGSTQHPPRAASTPSAAQPALGWELPCGVGNGAPALPWRGALLDVARHWKPKREVLAFIEVMAMHRLNTLHLHLSDDQGWRVECPSFPQLTEVGAWRAGSQVRPAPQGRRPRLDPTPHGGFYTAADLREITAYAAARSITVVPEIDLPGHSTAALAALPQLRVPELAARDDLFPGPEQTWGVFPATISPLPAAMEIVAALLAEVADAVPSGYLHIGGDECVVSQWEESAAVRQYAAVLGLASIDQLRAHVNGQLTGMVQQLGRRAVVWDEAWVAGGLERNVIVMAWRTAGLGALAAADGYDVIECPEFPAYFNWAESRDAAEPVSIGGPITLTDVATWDPAAGYGDHRHHLLGLQGALWSEYMPRYSDVEYFAFPRLAVLAASAWAGAAAGKEPGGPGWLPAQLRRLDAAGVGYRPPSGPKPWQRGSTGVGASVSETSRRPPRPEPRSLLPRPRAI